MTPGAAHTAWKGNLTNSSGFTLAEVIVYVAIITTAMGLVGNTVFQSLAGQQATTGSAVAAKELRRAGTWFVADALNAQTSDLVDAGPPVTSTTMSWTDAAGMPHTASYSIAATSLVRDLDGVLTVVGRNMDSADFSLSGKVLTLDLVVDAGRGETRSISFQTYLRMLP